VHLSHGSQGKNCFQGDVWTICVHYVEISHVSREYPVTCHTFRATGITTFLENGGDLETAQRVAGHASANTTRIYDHREQKVAQEEIERVRI